jgi:CysZ protein
MQIVRGFVAPFRGALFVARHGLWGYLVAPVLINLALVVLAGWAGGRWGTGWLDLDVGTSAVSVAGRMLVWLAVALVALVLFLVLQPILTGPFVDLLSEKCERIVRGHAPSPGVMRAAVLAVGHGALKSGLYVAALGFTLVAGALTGVGAVIGAVVYAAFIAFDAFDYPLARRNVSFMGKWRYLLSRPGQTVGYCCGAVLLYLVPLLVSWVVPWAAVVAPAFAAVGATLLHLDSAGPAGAVAVPPTNASVTQHSDISQDTSQRTQSLR